MLKKYLTKGFYGYYNYVYSQTVYLLRKSDKKLINYFSILTAIENKVGYSVKTHKFGNLNSDFSFGLYQRFHSIKWLEDFENDLRCKNQFIENGKNIEIGSLKLVSEQLVTPSISTSPHKLIKSNTASYIWEFFDIEKLKLEFVIENISLKDKMNKKLFEHGIDLSDIDERLGNVIIEFPNNLVIDTKRIENIDIEVVWDSRFQDQDKVKAILTKESNSLNDFRIVDLNNDKIVFTDREKHQKVKLISSDRNVVLFDSNNCKGFSMQIGIAQILDEKRILTITGAEIEISKTPNYSIAGDPIDQISSCIASYRNKRKIIENINNLKHQQYLNSSSDLTKEERHVKGLNDLNKLVSEHGGSGFSIWDPYLSGKDIYKLVIEKYKRTSLVRALGSKKIYESGCKKYQSEEGKVRRQQWFAEQKEYLENSSNHVGLNLEFRCAHSTEDSSFHDRFIIFNSIGVEKKSRVWSLGISINQFGKEHHVLHEIEFPDFIIRSFEALWNKLGSKENLVFKKDFTI